jgi:hypothetical protein
VPKKRENVRLSAVLWAQVDDLKGLYGDDRGEVLTHILTDWFSDNHDKITAQKARVTGLAKEIAVIQQQAEKQNRANRDEG